MARPERRISYWLCPYDFTPMESPNMNSDTHHCTKCGYWMDAWYPGPLDWHVEFPRGEYATLMDQLYVDDRWYVVWRDCIVDGTGRWVGSRTRVWTSP